MNKSPDQARSQPNSKRRQSKRRWWVVLAVPVGCLVLLTVLYVLWARSSDSVEDSGRQRDAAVDEGRAGEAPGDQPATEPASEPVTEPDSPPDDDAPRHDPFSDLLELRSGRIWVPWPDTPAPDVGRASLTSVRQLWDATMPPYTAEATEAFERRRRVAKERPDQWFTFEPIVEGSDLDVDYEINDERTDVIERISLCPPLLGASTAQLATTQTSISRASPAKRTADLRAAATFALAHHLVSRAVLSRGPQSLFEACMDAALIDGSQSSAPIDGSQHSALVGEVELLWARGLRLEETARAPSGAWVLWHTDDVVHLVVCHQPDTTYVADASTRERLVLLAGLPERAEAVELDRDGDEFKLAELRPFAGECAEGSTSANGDASRGAGYDRAAAWVGARREQLLVSAAADDRADVWIEVTERDAWRTVVAARSRFAGSFE